MKNIESKRLGNGLPRGIYIPRGITSHQPKNASIAYEGWKTQRLSDPKSPLRPINQCLAQDARDDDDELDLQVTERVTFAPELDNDAPATNHR